MRDYQDQDMMIRNRYRDRDRDSDRDRMDERGRGSAFFGSREPDRHEREHRGYRQESGWDRSDDQRDRDSGRGRRGSERRERDPEFGSDAYHKGIPMDETRHLIASNKVEGTPVYGRDGDRIGSIENFMVDKFKGEAGFPLLGANIRQSADGGEAFTPYLLKDVCGVKVGILGLVTPGVTTWERPENIPGLRFDDPLETARVYVPRMRQEGRGRKVNQAAA